MPTKRWQAHILRDDRSFGNHMVMALRPIRRSAQRTVSEGAEKRSWRNKASQVRRGSHRRHLTATQKSTNGGGGWRPI